MKLSKSIYFKLAIIPAMALFFFVQTYVYSNTNLTFVKNSLRYVHLTSNADNIFFEGLSHIQSSLINDTTFPTNLSFNYLSYYREYFDLHYDTFGSIDEFHQLFTSLFMLDICKGDVIIP
jgi:hypothetical protein